ncbi:hypothetical protein [Streptomyces sp. NPDC001876]|uniref:hypothetical protein n=1 Tax=Streptomyces sp. NPDC001876 TaxID=3154402 RepID=UPI0033192711
MTTNYPLVDEKVLLPTQVSGRLIRRHRRDLAEIPVPRAHEILVFRLGGSYVADSGRRSGDDPLLCDATSVTVVDTSAGVPVTVEVDVPSAEAEPFTLNVTFACTVTDPVAVVRAGLRDLPGVLLTRVRALPGLTETSGRYRLTQSHDLARALTARLTAYTEMEDAGLYGVTLGSVAVTVLSPEAVAELQRKQDEERRTMEAARELRDVKLAHDVLQAELKEMEQKLRRQEQAQEHLTRTQQRRFGYAEAEEDQVHAQTLAAEQAHFDREQATEEARAIDGNPLTADQMARARGEISSDEVAGRLRNDVSAQRERQYVVEDKEFEQGRIEAQLTREETREEKRHQQRLDQEKHQNTRELEAQKRRETREDAKAAADEKRRDRELQRQRDHETRKALIARGHFDDQYIPAEALLTREPAAPDSALSPADDAAELEPGDRGQAAHPAGKPGDEENGRGPGPAGETSADGLGDLIAADDLGDVGEEERAR